jgi:UDPglucose--hexose-1-phosphate uridylyltransferase
MTTPDYAPILGGDPHRRHDPLQDTWVLVSAGRTSRPWQGAEELPPVVNRPAFDPTCYLCPGNTRANGAVNPAYDATYAFVNDFSALRAATTEATFEDGLLRAAGQRGECRVICYSPRHDLTLGGMEEAGVRRVVDLWADQSAELGARYRWVQVFENRGAAMGASNPHPHGQVWAGTALPVMAAREVETQVRHHEATGNRLLLDVVAQEAGGPRVIVETEEWIGLVPFWASWPFETLLVARRPVARLEELDMSQRDDLARVLRTHIGAYDGLFEMEFPYSMGWHQAPGPGDADDEGDAAVARVADAWQLHAHFYPPLLRAGTRKFRVGYELLSETQRDLAPESAAERLRAVLAVEAR